MSSLVKKAGINSPLAQIKALESDPALLALCAAHLPPNYDFEIPKTVWRIRKIPDCKTVALQMPEGLLIFASKVAEVLRQFTGVDTILMGDVTYGACCVDDFTASMLGAQLLVHYGHSCLVPTTVANRIDTIYVFVTIQFNVDSAVESIRALLQSPDLKTRTSDKKIVLEQEGRPLIKVSLVSTIQFANSLAGIKQGMESESKELGSSGEGSNKEPFGRKVLVNIPRSKPLSSGEILGCTAPKVEDDLIIYVGDGRFHLEAMMMANSSLPAYRYDPYNRTLTEEVFDHPALNSSRQSALAPLLEAERLDKRLKIGIIQGTLGRQGNPKPVQHVYDKLAQRHDCFTILMSEVIPAKLALFRDVDLWVQFACPRLSIDWGDAFSVPILTPYEAMWALKNAPDPIFVEKAVQNSPISTESSTCGKSTCSCDEEYKGHPMDYYAYESLGPHTPNFMPPSNKPKPVRVVKA